MVTQMIGWNTILGDEVVLVKSRMEHLLQSRSAFLFSSLQSVDSIAALSREASTLALRLRHRARHRCSRRHRLLAAACLLLAADR